MTLVDGQVYFDRTKVETVEQALPTLDDIGRRRNAERQSARRPVRAVDAAVGAATGCKLW